MGDNVASPVFIENDGDVRRCRTLFDTLRAAAFGPAPPLDLLKRAAQHP